MESIKHLKKFDVVLVRDRFGDEWKPRLSDGNGAVLAIHGGKETTEWNYVIPIKGNEHLAYTTDDPTPPQNGEWWKVQCFDGSIRVVFMKEGNFYSNEKGGACVHNSIVEHICKMVPAK